MRLVPFHAVDGLPFSASACDVAARHGAPVRRSCNAAGLDEWDYGDVVFRFQVSTGRLEEVTRRAPVLYLGPLDVPFAALRSVVKAHDAAAFERAGFRVGFRAVGARLGDGAGGALHRHLAPDGWPRRVSGDFRAPAR